METMYYGFIEEIWELDYGAMKVPLFRYQWIRLEHINTDSDGITTI